MRLFTLTPLLLILPALGCGSDEPTPECTIDDDCPTALPVCDVGGGRCIECAVDDDCGNARPRCNTERNECVDCFRTSDCPSGRVCDEETQLCVDCLSDLDCSDQVYCNGVEVCDDGVCVDGNPIDCEDGFACTDDVCDEAANACVNEWNDRYCDNGDPCDGDEKCVPTDEDAAINGCIRGTPMRCDDLNDCTDDFCVDGECQADIRDADRDGYGDAACTLCEDPRVPETCRSGTDCDDNNPAVFPDSIEICDDGFDNNCDTVRDYADPACSITNDSCGEATYLAEGNVIHASTRGARADIDDTCGGGDDLDVVFAFTLTEERDVELAVTNRAAELSVSLSSGCGQRPLERRCLTGREVLMRARGLGVGTWFVIVSTPSESDFTVELSTSPSAPRPEGDLCETAEEVPTDGDPVAVDFTDAGADYDFSCVEGLDLFDVVYQFELDEEQTVDVNADITDGAGTIALSIQQVCGVSSTERLCLTGEGALEARLWVLQPGAYFLVAASDSLLDLEVSLEAFDVPPGLYFFENFDEEPGGWDLQGDVWEQGTLAGVDGDPDPDDGPCIGTTFGGDYTNNMRWDDDYAETPEIDLAGAVAPILEFRSWLDSESGYDGGHLEISFDGGPFRLLDPAGLDPAYNDDDIGEETAWAGAGFNSWRTVTAPLDDYVGSLIRLRFAFYSDGSSLRNGWYIDSVRVYEP